MAGNGIFESSSSISSNDDLYRGEFWLRMSARYFVSMIKGKRVPRTAWKSSTRSGKGPKKHAYKYTRSKNKLCPTRVVSLTCDTR